MFLMMSGLSLSGLEVSEANHTHAASLTRSNQVSAPPPQESFYIFRDGMLPPHRQMFYQLCDLEVDRYDAGGEALCARLETPEICVCCCRLFSIKELMEKNSGKEQECDERDGWCVLGTTDKLRDIISTMIKKVVRAKKPGKETEALTL